MFLIDINGYTKNTHINKVYTEVMQLSPINRFDAKGTGHNPKLNSAYYHRLYSNKRYGTDDMLPFRRSFSDETIFMAMNSRPEVIIFYVLCILFITSIL